MKPSKSWPWVLGAAIAGVAVGLLLGRTGQAAPGRPDAAASTTRAARIPSASVAALPAGPGVAPSAPQGPVPAPAASPARPAPAEPVSAESASGAPPPANEWDKIPIDRAFGETLGSFPTRQAFSKGMRSLSPFVPCVKQWKAPAHLDKVELDTELRIRSEEGAFVIEDVAIIDGNVADAALEACVIESYRGRRIPVSGVEPGRRYRIKWGGTVALK